MSDTLAALQTLLRDRHSCRAFLPDQIDSDTIADIVRDAGRVPSWCNAQPWQVIITRGANTDRFRDTMVQALENGSSGGDFDFPKSYSGPYQERRRTTGWQLYDAVGVTKGDRAGSAKQMAENYRLFGAPHCAVITTPAELGTYGAVDCGGFVTAFCLAAEARGVATVAQAALAFYAPAVREFFDIPDDRHILCCISFGRKDETHPANSFRTHRADVDDVIDWRD